MKHALDLISQYTEEMRGLALKAEDGIPVGDATRELIRHATEQFRSVRDGSDAIESTRALRARLMRISETAADTQIRFRVAIDVAVSLLDQA
ncbi:hypothetical protein J8I26_00710 [Herbaspirillum sp. LeCh32-8]|uniref:hypothetical protein n=1 Tax=Herbaspirillum sp. LeCh32-8 TaxID=2821356 RepID=UPI001AE5866A|nr:hypothetical protein [Herbaspirillum sp. LeCh32-8]MBP0596613.1 hypothetical protein [Herbaspirillum sp. LeCh32-8]